MGPASPAYGEPDFSCSRPGKGKKRRQREAFWRESRDVTARTLEGANAR
jgi:hypothetical protein